MDNKKLKFIKVKDDARKVEISDFGIEIKAGNGGDLLECYESDIENKDTEKNK